MRIPFRLPQLSERAATAGLFFVNGAVVGTWIAKVPFTQERFALSEGTVGVLLMAMALAVIVTLPLAGRAITRHGSGAVARAAGLASVVAVNLPVLAPD